MTVEHRGKQVTFEKPPARVLLITRYFAPLLEAGSAIDKVVAKIGEFPCELYAQPTRAVLKRVPTMVRRRARPRCGQGRLYP